MDRIPEILHKYERWVESLEPRGDDTLKSAHWDAVGQHAERILHLHEMLANIRNLEGHNEHGKPTAGTY